MSALAILLVALILRSTDDQAEKARVVEAKLSFDSAAACETAKTLAADFPERGMGAAGSRAAADWIEARMKGMRLDTERREFDAWIAGERVTGQNVIGIDRGVRDEVVVLIAHYDIPFHVREGAMDDASGVGAMLEIARVFSREKQKKTLVFIASDGEEWGMLGARDYARSVADPQKIRAVISLDCVSLEVPEKIGVRGEGQFRGQMPMWLWLLAEDCITEVGGEPVSDGTFGQFLSQAVNISSTDQGPFLAAGIPGVNLIGALSDSPLSREVYHTKSDTSENLRPELFEFYGKSAELMVRSLDALDQPLDNNPDYLRTGMRSYVGGAGLLSMQIIVFIPLLLATIFHYYNIRSRENLARDALVEVANLCLFVLPWAVALVTLYLLVWKNAIPRYELYPATPLDPFLSRPSWAAISVVAAAAAAGWVAVLFIRRALKFSGEPGFAVSKAVSLDFLLSVGVVALFLNAHAACLFLAPAAFLWSWIDRGRTPGRVWMNVALAIGGAAPFLALTLTFADSLRLGPYVLWYYLLGAGYGFFSPLTVLIAVAAATVGVRLIQQSLSGAEASPEDGTPEPTEAGAE